MLVSSVLIIIIMIIIIFCIFYFIITSQTNTSAYVKFITIGSAKCFRDISGWIEF